MLWSSENKHDVMVSAVILSSLILAITLWKMLRTRSRPEKLLMPPGPLGLPLIGYLPFLNLDLHRCFTLLSHKYGPIMKVQLGSRPCIVFSSPEAAKQVLQVHDQNFADRDAPVAAVVCTYGALDIAFPPYGEDWRMMRKVCVRELLSHRNLGALYGLRRTEVRDMVSKIYSETGRSIDIGENVFLAMINIITSMMWGNTLDRDERSHVSARVRVVVQKMAELIGEANISDYFPVFAQFDIQGKERHMKGLVKWFDQIFEFVLDRHSKMDSGEDEANASFVQILLQLINQRDQKKTVTVTHLKALFVDMLIAGTRSTSTTVEWAIAELMNKPEKMRKARDELERVVGINNVVEENHTPKLPYMDAVIKEVLRLHGAPFLIPRRARESCVVGGYLIPKGAKILVNAWAIHGDPKYWNDPSQFHPERFLNSGVDLEYKKNEFHYLPFGAGRRICVGISLVEKSTSFLLGSLLHSFSWRLPEGANLDLSEKFGLQLKKRIPLVAIPTPRLPDNVFH